MNRNLMVGDEEVYPMTGQKNSAGKKYVTDGGDSSNDLAWMFSESSPFVHLLENQGRVKTLDTLIRRHGSKLTAEEIATQAGMSVSTFSRNKDFLIDLHIVNVFKDRGTTRYQINKNNEVVQLLVEFHTELLDYADEIIESGSKTRMETAEEALSLIETSSGEAESRVDFHDSVLAYIKKKEHA